jgi:hypothetical protein
MGGFAHLYCDPGEKLPRLTPVRFFADGICSAAFFILEGYHMAKVAEYHTDSPEYPLKQREVYHDHDDCADGRRIKTLHRKPGRGFPPRRRCDECIKLG